MPDVDGTVATCPYDFDAMRAAVSQAAARFHIDAAALGIRGIIEQITAIAIQLGEEGPAFKRAANEAVQQLEIEAARTASLLPGVEQALGRLRAEGIAVALITRNCRKAASIVLEDFTEYDALLTREDVPRAKPDPDHVLRALAVVEKPAAEAVVVGDHGFDMQAGRAAGVQVCVGVRTGNNPDESLLIAGADTVLDSLAELPEWLQHYHRVGP